MTAGPPTDADVSALAAGMPLVLLLDVDGTLAPIALTPEGAGVPELTRQVLAELTAMPDVVVSLVSGRSADDARRLVAVRGVWAIGNHGAECATPDGGVAVDQRVASFRPALERAIDALAERLAPLAGVRLEDKRWSLSVHYRLASRVDVPAVDAAVRAVAEHEGLRVHLGKEVLELRAPVDVDKGTAVVALLGRIGGLDRRAAVAYIGDDATDEDAFRALGADAPTALAVRVGGDDVATAAARLIPDPSAVQRFLALIAEMRRGRAG